MHVNKYLLPKRAAGQLNRRVYARNGVFKYLSALAWYAAFDPVLDLLVHSWPVVSRPDKTRSSVDSAVGLAVQPVENSAAVL